MGRLHAAAKATEAAAPEATEAATAAAHRIAGTPTHRYERTREATMAAFAKSWRRETRGTRRAIMRAIGLVSVSLVMTTLLATDAEAATSNRRCAVTHKRSENCGYATLDQCRAYVLGLGGWWVRAQRRSARAMRCTTIAANIPRHVPATLAAKSMNWG